MPRKKLSGETPGVQIVFRVPQNLRDALGIAADGLNLDLSSLLRLLIAEHLPEYIERAKQATVAMEHARAEGHATSSTPDQPRQQFHRQPRRTIILDTQADL